MMVRWPHNTRTAGRISCGQLAARFMVNWPPDVALYLADAGLPEAGQPRQQLVARQAVAFS